MGFGGLGSGGFVLLEACKALEIPVAPEVCVAILKLQGITLLSCGQAEGKGLGFRVQNSSKSYSSKHQSSESSLDPKP